MQSRSTRRKKMTVGLLYGGRSGEHDVSLCSAASVYAALDKRRYEVIAIGIDRDGRWYVQDHPEVINDPAFGKVMALKKRGVWLVNHYEENSRLFVRNLEHQTEVVSLDLIFPVLHGTYGEDGTLQGLLELARVPYVGVDVAGAAIGMDKDIAKRLLAQSGIPVVPWMTIGRRQWTQQTGSITRDAIKTLGLPLFVKPLCTGSSVGVVKVTKQAALASAVEHAFRFDTRIMLERGIDCREIECAVLGNDAPQTSVLGEILTRHDFYSYEAKYLDPQGAAMNVPAKIPTKLAGAIRKCAKAGYLALNCNGMARVDFFLDKNNGAFYLNEINTLPGFTSISMYPRLWEATGVPYAKLLDTLIDLALDRHHQKMAIETIGV